MLRFKIALALAGLTVLGGPAHAEPSEMSTEAKKHFDRGLELYNVELYEYAIVEFKAAQQADPRPELLYALGQAQRMNKDCRAAILSYEAFLRTGPGPRQEAPARVQLDACRAATGAAGDAGVPADPSTGAAAAAPPLEPTRPPPIVQKWIDPPPQLTAAAADRPAPVPLHRRWWLWAIVGGGIAAGLAVAAATGAFTRRADAPCGERTCLTPGS